VLEPIVMKALANDPDDRHATALELAAELADVAESLGDRPDVGAFLRDLLAARIEERRAFLDEALADADARQQARDASTVPPPRSKAPSKKPPTLIPPGEESLGAFSSLQALVLSGRAPAVPGETTGVRAIPSPRARRRNLPLIALASALAAACVFSLSVTHEPANARVAYTTLGAPVRLAAKALARLAR
jgi:hypothetical protein